jgi:hypothetical protein
MEKELAWGIDWKAMALVASKRKRIESMDVNASDGHSVAGFWMRQLSGYRTVEWEPGGFSVCGFDR